ncbi:M16 family metallopeptidase [Mucilaginibacter sp. UYCu711]|uniref:M16 family metallopeptidase n=1 Tax=Mucilaginibacter sp. UYCu711 TaxID=3156339 RepID=UPI003D22B321
MNFRKTILLWAVTLLVTTGSAFAQVKKKPAPTKRTTAAIKQQAGAVTAAALPVDPNVIVGKLPNGLTYYVRANNQLKGKAQLMLVNKAGSVLETEAQRGMATLIQRMAFNGTRDFAKADMASYLTKLGIKYGPDINAITSFDETIYQLSVPTDTPKVFANGFSLLANWAARINFDAAALSAEKTTLAAQAALGGKNAEDRLQQQTLPVLLNKSPYAYRMPMGTETTVKGFTEAAVKSFYADWYRPDMQAIIAVGDFDPKQVEEQIKFNFSSLRNPSPAKPQPQYTVTPTAGTTVKIATDKDFNYTLFQVIVKHPQAIVKTQADYLQSMRITLFNQILNTRVTELTKIPAPPILFGQAAYADFIGKQDAFSALAVVNSPQSLEAGVKAVMAEVLRARKFGFTVTELERAKQIALSQITNAYNAKDNTPPANFAGDYERNFINKQAIPGIDFEYNYYINNIGKITLAEMNALAARLISDQNRVILLEANDAQKGNLPNEQTLLKWVADAGTGLTPYVDDSSTPFMAALPTPGKVETMKVDSTISVTTVTLTNGIKVILKPTTFTPGQILIAGYSFGGTSLAGDQDFLSANIAANIVSNSGVAGFNQTQLVKMMRDKSFSITPYISDITQGVSGYAVGDSFEPALQLLHLYFTSPRKDAEVWKTYISQAQSALTRNANAPGSVYQDTVLAVLGNYSPRSMAATADKLNAASLDKAYDFYKARFADASNFTFTFTGDFSVNAIIPYLATYLGSLPSTNGKETFKNLGIHPSAGQVTKTIYKGAGNKATVQLIFSGDYNYNDENNTQIDALEEILNIRLVDSLKDGNGIYSPGVRVNYGKNPEGRYKVTLSFLADVDGVDKATAYILNEINKLKQNGAADNDVKLFIARQARTIQSQYKQNTFWQATLTTSAQNQEDPDKILSRVQDPGQVTQQSTKDAAIRYLGGNNLIKIILLPEKK